MTNARDKANNPQLNFTSKGIDDNADAVAITIDSSGKVAIGSTDNGVGGTIDLSVGSTSSSGGITLWSPTSSTHSLGFGDGTSGADRYRGYLEYAHNGDSMRFATASTERMRIVADGSVGIANTIPSTFNSQARNLVIGSGSGDAGMTIYSGSGSGDSGNIFFADGTSGSDPVRGGITYKHDTNQMLFRVNDVNKLTIDSSGNVNAVSGLSVPSEGIGVLATKDLGIGIHIKESDTGGSVDAWADHLVIEGNTDVGMTILAGATSDASINFADSGDNDAGRITYNHNFNELKFYNGGAERIGIDTAGLIKVNNGIALGGTGSANTLDDYEEGTFTPDLDDSSNNSPTSMYQAQGFYTKVGRAVTIQVYVEVNVKGSGMSGNVMRISNLPFTPVGTNLSFHSMAVSYISNLDVNSKPVGGAVYSDNSFIYLYYINGDNSAQITPSMISNGTRIALGGTYMSS